MSWSKFGLDDISTPATKENGSGFNSCIYQAAFFLASLLQWRLASYRGSFETRLDGSQKKLSLKSSQFLLGIWIQYQLSVMWANHFGFIWGWKIYANLGFSLVIQLYMCKVSTLLYHCYNSADGNVTPFYRTLALKEYFLNLRIGSWRSKQNSLCRDGIFCDFPLGFSQSLAI